MPRITHEVLDQVCLFNYPLDIRAATSRCRPTFLPPERIPVVKRKRNRNQGKPLKPGDPVLANGRAVCGIDIGKRRHAAAALSPQGEILARLDAFPNTQAGIDRLEQEVLRKAGGPGKVLVAMEATGHYWMCLYVNLRRRGYDCVVLNPLQTSARGNVRIRKTQTDRIDAVGIARLILCGDAKATRVPDPAILELRLLVRHRRRLLRAVGGIERYAHTLIDRVFPEYADVFCNPFLPSSEKLIRQVGLSPHNLVEKESEVREILRIASRAAGAYRRGGIGGARRADGAGEAQEAHPRQEAAQDRAHRGRRASQAQTSASRGTRRRSDEEGARLAPVAHARPGAARGGGGRGARDLRRGEQAALA
jgi:transposase